jgi:long-chain acyl-CoA synthetase
MSLTMSVHRAARISPAKTATIFLDRRRTWSEFATRVARLAGVLADLGIGPDDRVAMLSHSSDRYLEFFFATLWAGGIAVPVSTRYALPETQFLMEDCEASVLLVGDEFADMAATLKEAVPTLKHLVHAGEGPLPPAWSTTRRWSPPAPRSPMPAAPARTSRCCSTPEAPPAGRRG